MFLLILQFAAIAVILWPSGWSWPSWWSGGLMLAGLGLTLWALAHNRPGNFRLSAAPRTDAALITGGPYRRIRHPMYLALLLMMAGVCGVRNEIAAWLAWGVLLIVLLLKARREEALLARQFADYASYRSKTWL
jgi:protein-S-isoprenylcysteine O-methyltransferase Ste14